MLQALLTIQQAKGYVPVEDLPQMAHALGVTEADIAGVLS
jgi:NADH:ubiquinone oxidoreductase subunit E